jgi:hypothetical protein
VLESVWAVIRGNMSLIISILTSTLSIVFGGGTAILNFVVAAVSTCISFYFFFFCVCFLFVFCCVFSHSKSNEYFILI